MARYGVFALAALVAACSGGSGGNGSSGFQVVEFLESGKNELPRNRELVFQFSEPVAPNQDLAERLEIQNIDTGSPSNFSRAIGTYVIDGDRVRFLPRLPEKPDRSDAGFRADGSYHVFLKAGPDALESTQGNLIASPQEFLFETSEFFEDPLPQQPPRAIRLAAVDPLTLAETDLSRLAPTKSGLDALDSAALLASGRIIEPGAGGPPQYGTSWRFELHVSEPVDPQTVTAKNVKLTEIRHDALDASNQAAPGHFGDPVSFAVPVDVSVEQIYAASGDTDTVIRVTPRQTLVDDARYRIVFSGDILGIDFRKAFIGENGLTGDGLTVAEPGGTGYAADFLVYDRPAIVSQRTLTFDPLVDGVEPEFGDTTTDEAMFNSALYNPPSNPGRAVGFLSAFGQGTDGDLAVSAGNTLVLNTGDVRNPDIGNPFAVQDLNPDEDYLGNPLPGGPVTYDSPEPFELELSSLTISSSSTLRVVGVNPLLLRVQGIAQISGKIDAAGGDGGHAGGSTAVGGAAGPAGFPGGSGRKGSQCTSLTSGGCHEFSVFLNACSNNKASFPHGLNGQGPGRGFAGGEMFAYYYYDQTNHATGTGGGGASHATKGQAGEDRLNPPPQTPGTPGTACSYYPTSGYYQYHNSGVIGVRSQPGATYGDAEIFAVTLGGSGGAAGGTAHGYYYPSNGAPAPGAGGGGGGSISIVASGPILIQGGVIDVSGGDGGNGHMFRPYNLITPGYGLMATGGGGGGSGGSLVLISGDSIQVVGGSILDATGGEGGARGFMPGQTCNGCNGGGDGGSGFIFMMDADGEIEGFLPGIPGTYPGHASGYVTISEFDATRFSTITAVTELFGVPAADPDFLSLTPQDIVGNVNPNQRIIILASSAQPSAKDPLVPDLATETPAVEVARIVFAGGGAQVQITGDLGDLNTPGRDAFVRIQAVFEYDDNVEAALGPFASIDEVVLPFTFNG